MSKVSLQTIHQSSLTPLFRCRAEDLGLLYHQTKRVWLIESIYANQDPTERRNRPWYTVDRRPVNERWNKIGRQMGTYSITLLQCRPFTKHKHTYCIIYFLDPPLYCKNSNSNSEISVGLEFSHGFLWNKSVVFFLSLSLFVYFLLLV
jgi:hypothetical protein